ncbi:MAG: hypothetical protein H8E13_04775 [Actinobacteria bacterium]|nr:hypothetical protein [Actinomycetota bacterium]
MGKLIIIASIIIAVIVMAFTFSSCEKAEEEIAGQMVEKPVESETVEGTKDIETDNGIDVDTDVDATKGELKITGDDEEEINTGEADIPDGWPSEVPIHPDLEIISSSIFTQEGEKAFQVSAMYEKGSSLELFNWYKSKLSPSWEIVSESSVDSDEDGFFYSITANTSLYALYLTITEFEGEISVSINVGEE